MLFLILIVLILCFTVYEANVQSVCITNSNITNQSHKMCFCLLSFIIIMITACRYQTGQDWITYEAYFNNCIYNEWDGSIEYGYHVINVIFRKTFNDYYVMQFCLSAFASLVFFRHFYNSFQSPFYTLLLYFLLLYYFLIDMTTVRQFIAMSIIILGLKQIEKGNILKWSLIVLLAMQFHASAIVAFFLFFTNKVNINKKTATIFLAIIIWIELMGLNMTKSAVEIISSMSFLPSRIQYIASVYLRREDLAKQAQYGSGIGVLMNYLFYTIIIMKDNGKKSNSYLLNFMIALLCFAMGRNFGVITRVGYYYIICGNGLNAYSNLKVQESDYNTNGLFKGRKLLLSQTIIIMFLVFRLLFFYISWNTESNGVVFSSHYDPYYSILFNS